MQRDVDIKRKWNYNKKIWEIKRTSILEKRRGNNERRKSEQFVRIGLQTNRLPFGSAVLISTHWTYYISPIKFYSFLGKEIKQEQPKKRKKETTKKK